MDAAQSSGNEVEVAFSFAEVVEKAGQVVFAMNANPSYADWKFAQLIEACDKLPMEDGAAQIGLSLEVGSVPRIVDLNIRVEVRDVTTG